MLLHVAKGRLFPICPRLAPSVFMSSGGGAPGDPWTCVPLPDRGVVRVSGGEAATFLQGLMTNDINLVVEEGRKSIYCAFLNTGGRILFDAILSTGFHPSEWLLDVDKQAVSLARRHLTLHKVRKKLNIQAADDLRVYAAFRPGLIHTPTTGDLLTTQAPLVGSTFCDGGTGVDVSNPLSPQDSCLAHPDPRLDLLGHRLITDQNQDPLTHLPAGSVTQASDQFTQLRCSLGVTEGVWDTPSGKCFPLEYNMDYLHGVSFQKGCYVGQELTARTHHTGVVRKRILPIKLSEDVIKDEGEELTVVTEAGKSVGKVRRLEGRLGLALIRLKEGFSAPRLFVKGVEVELFKPVWWPPEKEDKSNARSA